MNRTHNSVNNHIKYGVNGFEDKEDSGHSSSGVYNYSNASFSSGNDSFNNNNINNTTNNHTNNKINANSNFSSPLGMSNSNAAVYKSLSLKVVIVDLLKEVYLNDVDETYTAGDVKRRILDKYGRLLDECGMNHGIFLPHSLKKSGKFLQEERMLADYCLLTASTPGNAVGLEFKKKQRVNWARPVINDLAAIQRKLSSKSKKLKFINQIIRCDTEKVEKLLNKGFDPNFQCVTSGETPLTLSVHVNAYAHLIQLLVSGGALLDYRARDGQTALHKAVAIGNAAALSILLNFGMSPNITDLTGLTPLHYAIIHNANIMCAEKLLFERAVIGFPDRRGMFEIHMAARLGKCEHIELLWRYGANLDLRTHFRDSTALHVAAFSGQAGVARLLLERGCAWHLLNGAGRSAAREARICGYHAISQMISEYEAMQPRPPTYLPSPPAFPPPPLPPGAVTTNSSSSSNNNNSTASAATQPHSNSFSSGATGSSASQRQANCAALRNLSRRMEVHLLLPAEQRRQTLASNSLSDVIANRMTYHHQQQHHHHHHHNQHQQRSGTASNTSSFIYLDESGNSGTVSTAAPPQSAFGGPTAAAHFAKMPVPKIQSDRLMPKLMMQQKKKMKDVSSGSVDQSDAIKAIPFSKSVHRRRQSSDCRLSQSNSTSTLTSGGTLVQFPISGGIAAPLVMPINQHHQQHQQMMINDAMLPRSRATRTSRSHAKNSQDWLELRRSQSISNLEAAFCAANGSATDRSQSSRMYSGVTTSAVPTGFTPGHANTIQRPASHRSTGNLLAPEVGPAQFASHHSHASHAAHQHHPNPETSHYEYAHPLGIGTLPSKLSSSHARSKSVSAAKQNAHARHLTNQNQAGLSNQRYAPLLLDQLAGPPHTQQQPPPHSHQIYSTTQQMSTLQSQQPPQQQQQRERRSSSAARCPVSSMRVKRPHIGAAGAPYESLDNNDESILVESSYHDPYAVRISRHQRAHPPPHPAQFVPHH